MHTLAAFKGNYLVSVSSSGPSTSLPPANIQPNDVKFVLVSLICDRTWQFQQMDSAPGWLSSLQWRLAKAVGATSCAYPAPMHPKYTHLMYPKSFLTCQISGLGINLIHFAEVQDQPGIKV